MPLHARQYHGKAQEDDSREAEEEPGPGLGAGLGRGSKLLRGGRTGLRLPIRKRRGRP